MSKFSNLTLWEALGKYSNEALWNEYLSQRGKSAGGVGAYGRLTEKMKDNKPSIQEFFQGFQKATWESSNDQKTTRELFKALISEFKLKFASSELFAYGYLIPRKAEDKPSLIPLDVISKGTIDWEASSVTGNGLEFVWVMVLEDRLIGELDETINLISNERELIDKPKKGKGRPSYKDLIKEIYLLEKNNGNINFSLI